MTKHYKWVTSSILLACVLTLAACSSDSKDAALNPPNTPITAPATTTMLPSDASSPLQNITEPEIVTLPSGSEPISSAASTAAIEKTRTKLIQDLLALAKIGQVPNVGYAAHTGLIDDVEKAWGQAEKKEPAGQGIYATYSKKNIVFGFNKGSQIFDVRSNDPLLQELTLPQIKQVLGSPQDTKINGDDMIYIYKANDQYQLKFIIPKTTGQVDHISVFSPKDSVNNMAG